MNGIRELYPFCVELFESNFLPLHSSFARQALYVRTNNDRYVFENPLFTPDVSRKSMFGTREKNQMRAKDFLASIPAFADFSDQQLTVMEQKSTVCRIPAGEVVFRQGEDGDKFYVINQGCVDVLIQDNASALSRGDLGRIVNRLTEGCYFGERALIHKEKRAASIRTTQDTICLVFSRSVYEEVISGGNALIGQDNDVEVDWSKDHETRSLFKHIENILDIEKSNASPKIKRILYELSTAFTPELLPDEIIARMVMTVKIALKVDRVGLFVLSEDRRSMILKVSERSKGVRLPIRGLAGAVLQNNIAINIADAYQDPRFDSTMDRRTGYRTRQVLGVPLRDPLTGQAMGVLQVNNKQDSIGSDTFSSEQQRVLELAAEQLSELLLGRADVFVATGAGKGLGQGVGDGMVLLNSADLTMPFTIDLTSFQVGNSIREVIIKENLVALELQVSLHLALSQLCDAQKVFLDLPSGKPANGGGSGRSATPSFSFNFSVHERVAFDVSVRDLPRATRVLVKVSGYKKKKGSAPGNRILLGWVACVIFDFKGCLESMQGLKFFPAGEREVEVPINTTLSNHHNEVGQIGLILAPDVILSPDTGTPRVRIVHSMPVRSDPFEAADTSSTGGLTEVDNDELERIHIMAYNPMSLTIIGPREKAFLWRIRFSIFHRPSLLPAFVMAINWSSCEQVQELYDLLDLWSPPTAVEALQLLDRRFMDPKVRAYAVHCLEDLSDEELSLYMLQLCQQLKFENFVDSALARFLLRRALTNNKLIGHIYFWLLQAEVHNADVKKRYIVLLQVYIRNCGSHRIELGHQMFVMKRLEKVALEVAQGSSKEERKQILHIKLNEAKQHFPENFKLPLNPQRSLCDIIVEKCRVMESKKKPLWLTFKDSVPGNENLVLMLKVGDDLRQDALIMQLLRVMDNLWKREGLDMQMKLYDCISTGDERGLLQVVLKAKTLANILMEATDRQGANKTGSLSRKLMSAMKALSDFNVFSEWIREQVTLDADFANMSTADQEDEFNRRVQSFMISTAAYCVASYVLGLGDRHNDNLMMTQSGHFFHIDFGHILGNFKSKMGVQRERAPFVFTHAMRAVMKGDEQYEAFVDLCCDVYNILRENATLLVSLFSLAIPCNLPELQTEKDVLWIYEKLMVGASDEDAADHFKKQLKVSLNTRGTRINDAAHMLAHA
jgi:phosphatidylinositol-4,5-bisphosphate 3-kinase